LVLTGQLTLTVPDHLTSLNNAGTIFAGLQAQVLILKYFFCPVRASVECDLNQKRSRLLKEAAQRNGF